MTTASAPADRRLYTAAAVAELDRRAIHDHGTAGYDLMCAAGAAVYRLLCLRWPAARQLLVVCGGGNNGGDGLVVARLARAAGRDVRVVLTRAPERLAGEAAAAWADFAAAGGDALAPADVDCADCDLVVDALLGTGLDRPVAGTAAGLIDDIRSAGRPVLAVDVPSGLSADSGAVLGTAVRADATLSFIGRKRGLYTGAGPDHAGALFFDTLATPAAIHVDLEPWVAWPDAGAVHRLLPPRLASGHKGGSGRLTVVGGNHGMCGAARLAAEAGARAGAGLVAVATRERHAAAIAGARPELMARGIEQPAAELPALLDPAGVLLIGPGLGHGSWAEAALGSALDTPARARVIDADGLNLLAAHGLTAGGAAVITPHPGEAARMLGCAVAAVEADRFAALEALVARHDCVVVLKGAGSLVGGPERRTHLIGEANPALATGGTGDVLGGVIAGLLAQGLAAFDAAIAGTWLHARAAHLAAAGRDRGLLAGDLPAWIGQLHAERRRA